MFEKPLFGATISPSCEYCEFGRKAPQPGCFYCEKRACAPNAQVPALPV